MGVPPPPPPEPPKMEAKGEAKAAKTAPKEEAKAAGKEAESSKGKSAIDALGRFFGAKVKRASVDASVEASICWVGGGIWAAGGCQTSPRASSAAGGCAAALLLPVTNKSWFVFKPLLLVPAFTARRRCWRSCYFQSSFFFFVRVWRIFKVAAPVAAHRLNSGVHANLTSSMKMLTC